MYAVQSDIENCFGTVNVAIWSNLDATSNVVDTGRIAVALAYADAEINNFFQAGPYTVPLVINSSAATVTNWAAIIAGVWLYSSREQADVVPTTDDGKKPDNKYFGKLKSVYMEMGLYKMGYKQLDAQRGSIPSGPVVVVV